MSIMKKIFQSKIFSLIFLILILVVTLYFGLRFKGYRPSNDVSWLDSQQGIRFGRYGIAYAELGPQDIFAHLKNFTIELALKPESREPSGFNIIMSVHDGKDSDQFIIGQWKSHVVIMNGDDYSHKRKVRRVSAEIFSGPINRTLLTVVSGDDEVLLFVNGRLIKTEKTFFLKIPHQERSLLTMGNSVYGNSSWTGNIYGLNIYRHALKPEEVEKHYQAWINTKSLLSLKDNPYLVFVFNKNMGAKVSDVVSGNINLNIPEFFTIFKKRFLTLPWEGFSFDEKNIKDMTINLLGFIPLGFVVFWFIVDIRMVSQTNGFLITLLFCFLISLFIEITQAWIPSRSSQLLDLILNTIGGIVGTYGARSLLYSRVNS
jgi:hypothetical protein